MRKKIVAGNWKMNLDYTSAMGLFSEVLNMINDEVHGAQEVVVCPPYLYIHSLVQLSKNNAKVGVGAQNCHEAASGAYTGEISAGMIQSVGARYVILGHSERRQYYGETNQTLAPKVDAALKVGLRPIFCIGETLEERNQNIHLDLIKAQLAEGVFHLSADDFSQIVIAYEPVWAIGTGVTATSDQAQEIHAFIRKEIATKYGAAVADDITVLYGGSCNAKNAPELFAQADIDGGLIGGASLKSRDFTDIVKVFNS
jgi:triosephosphate isomerase (TIM)